MEWSAFSRRQSAANQLKHHQLQDATAKSQSFRASRTAAGAKLESVLCWTSINAAARIDSGRLESRIGWTNSSCESVSRAEQTDHGHHQRVLQRHQMARYCCGQRRDREVHPQSDRARQRVQIQRWSKRREKQHKRVAFLVRLEVFNEQFLGARRSIREGDARESRLFCGLYATDESGQRSAGRARRQQDDLEAVYGRKDELLDGQLLHQLAGLTSVCCVVIVTWRELRKQLKEKLDQLSREWPQKVSLLCCRVKSLQTKHCCCFLSVVDSHQATTATTTARRSTMRFWPSD